MSGVDEKVDETRRLEARSKKFRADDERNDPREHLPHALEHGHGVLEDLFHVAKTHDLNENDEDPHHEERGDRIELHARDDEVRKDDEKRDRQYREESVPGGRVGRTRGFDFNGFRLRVVPLRVEAPLHDVVRRSRNEKRRNRDRELILDEVVDRVEPGHFGREARRPRRRCESHPGRRADHGRSGRSRHPDRLQNRKECDKKKHREARRRRNHHDKELTDHVPACKDEVRRLEAPQGLNGYIDERLGGADPIHVSGKTARRHDEKTGARALLRGDGLERCKNVEEPEARGFDALREERGVAQERDGDQNRETREKKDEVGLVALHERVARHRRHENGYPGKKRRHLSDFLR